MNIQPNGSIGGFKGAFRWILSGGILLCVVISYDVMAVLALDPTRIVFEGRTRSETVTIINQNTTPVTYRIFFKNKRMLENGDYIDIDSPGAGEQFADNLIRYSPRQVTIEPGQTQSVRLLLRKPKALIHGEYRSHFVVQEIPNANVGSNIEKIATKDGEVSVSLIANYAVSIPVIVRHGALNVQPVLEDLFFTNGTEKRPPVLSVKLLRTGNQSLYGDFSVIHVSTDGSEQQVGAMNGVALYSPYSSRTLSIPLNMSQDTTLQGGELKVIYRPREKVANPQQAEASLVLL